VAIPLGIPSVRPGTDAPSWRTAWDQALYGPAGFYRRHAPGDHFRTAMHGSDLMAAAFLTLVRRHGLDTVVDVGAGRGELLTGLHRLAPDLQLLGVEVAPRPQALPAPIAWSPVLPESVEGLVVAHEWLDNVPCHVVEVDGAGVPRIVHVDPATGRESWGLPVTSSGVPPSIAAWLAAWWPLDAREPGARAEVGTTRDRAWRDVVARVHRGLAVAVDYGHTRDDRPAGGSLRSYRRGRETEVAADGSRDVTAAVAVDSVAAAAGAEVVRQRQALTGLGMSTARPPLAMAAADPEGYARALAAATEAAGLTATGGLGDFYWVVSGAGGGPAGWEAG
jgi:SAM-dependent MidA family methyltransferase